MSASTEIKIDAHSRAYLRQFTKPGEMYLAEAPEPGLIVLRLMEPRAAALPRRKLSYRQALAAIKRSKLDLGLSYDELRKLTREP